MKRSIALVLTTLSIASVAVAQSTRDLDSHEHGAASMNIALDDNAVFIELESPWNNLIGFEHAPDTDEQHKLVDDAVALLNQPDRLFAFNGAVCSAAEVTLENGLADSDHDEHHDDDHKDADHDEHHNDDHKDADHDEHHDDHKDADHDEHHDDHDTAESSHASILLTAVFNCNNLENLTSIDAKLLSVWSGFEDLDVQLIGPGGQASVELSQTVTTVDVTPVQ